VFSQRNENDRPVQAGARRHPSPMDRRGDSVTAKLEDFVILSGATASRSEAVAKSKDPDQLKLADARQGILPCSRRRILCDSPLGFSPSPSVHSTNSISLLPSRRAILRLLRRRRFSARFKAPDETGAFALGRPTRLAVLRWVPDMQNFNSIAFHAVGDDMWQAPVQQFAGAFLTSPASTQGKLFQRAGGFADLNDGGPC